jgi:hypothetical protein
MLRKGRAFVFVGVSIFLSIMFFPTPAAYSAPLTERDARLIEIAYMNGFVAAVQLDAETIAKLKNDKELLRKFVLEKSKAYVDYIRHLNKDGGR